MVIITDGPLPSAAQLLIGERSPTWAYATIGLVEDGALDGKTIMDLRDLADTGEGAWDLANGDEISEAVYSMGAHLYQRFAPVYCHVIVFNYGRLGLYQQTVQSAITKLGSSLTAAMATTTIAVHWQAMVHQRAQVFEIPAQSLSTKHQCIARKAVPMGSMAERSQQEQRDMVGTNWHKSHPSMEKIIQWGLWLSGGALLSTLMLLAKK